MNKESRIYIRNVMKGKGFIIDFISTALAVGILIMVVFNSFGNGTGLYFVQIFGFGALLAFFNFVKQLKIRAGFSVAFAALGVLMAVMAVLCYFKL